MLKAGRCASRICSRFLSVEATTSREPELDFHRHEKNGSIHVTSLNVKTNERAIVELKLGENSKKSRKIRREYELPEDAKRGLKNLIAECSKPANQIQHEADILAERLKQRRFPASPEEVKGVRDQIKRQLRAEQKDSEDVFDHDGVLSQKIIEAREYQLRHKVDKYLKKTRYNWKPLEFSTKETATAYALARLAPNYAEISRVLEELKVENFAPESVLDFGGGSGAGFWAVNERFEKSLKEYCLVDLSDEMTKVSMDIMRKNNESLLSNKVNFRRHLLPSLQTTYDLVICHRTLCEIGSPETRVQTIESLWKRTNKFLVIIESSLDDSFNAVLDARDYLLTSGITIDREQLYELAKEKSLPIEEIANILNNRGLSNYEKYILINDKLPQDVTMPSNLPLASVFAPCPHDLGCPLRNKKSCSFPIRWKVLRADGKQTARIKDGTETGSFSFVIMKKGSREPDHTLPRILKMRKMNGHATCDVCTAFKGIQRYTLSKKGGELYNKMRMRSDGEVSPLQMQTKATEGVFDIYDEVVSSLK